MNVVQRLIAVQDVERLTDLNPEHARLVPAALLIEDGRRGGHRELQIAEPILHVHEYVLQSAAIDNERPRCFRALLRAVVVGREVDRLRCRRFAFERDRARDCRGRSRVDRIGDGCGRRWRRAGWLSFTATTRDRRCRYHCRKKKSARSDAHRHWTPKQTIISRRPRPRFCAARGPGTIAGSTSPPA